MNDITCGIFGEDEFRIIMMKINFDDYIRFHMGHCYDPIYSFYVRGRSFNRNIHDLLHTLHTSLNLT